MYVKDLAIAMSEQGHDVRILFLNRAADIGRDPDYEQHFLNELTQAKVSYGFIGYRARRNPLLGAYRMREENLRYRPDVLHCHLYYAAAFSLPTAGAKVLYTHHSIDVHAPRQLYRLLDLRVSAYVAICEACGALLHTLTRRPVIQIDNAVQPRRLTRRKLGRNDRKPVSIVVASRLSAEKNLGLLLKAAARLGDLDFVIKIAGEGPERQSLEQESALLGLTNKVTFLGNCRNISNLLSEADIFAMSSSYEGLPISLIEATLTGLPVVVTDVGGCAELVREVGNGIVVPANDLEGYSLGLRRLVVSGQLRETYAHNALRNSGRYQLATSVDAHLALYGHLTGRQADPL